MVERGTRRIAFERSLNTYRIWEWMRCTCGYCEGHWTVLCDEPDRYVAEGAATWGNGTKGQPLVYWSETTHECCSMCLSAPTPYPFQGQGICCCRELEYQERVAYLKARHNDQP